MSYVNRELLHAALKHIEDNPEDYQPINYGWDFPGWCLRLSQPELFVPITEQMDRDCRCGCGGAVKPRIVFMVPDGTGRHVELPPAVLVTWALVAMGITQQQLDLLLSGDLEIPHLRAAVEELTA